MTYDMSVRLIKALLGIVIVALLTGVASDHNLGAAIALVPIGSFALGFCLPRRRARVISIR
jgi:hypothetical protein